MSRIALDQRGYRTALGAFATGVTVVTTSAGDGFHGTTANSFTSVSLEPRLVLVSLASDSRTLAAVHAAGAFAVNVLTAEQDRLSRHFASRHRPPGSAGFAGTSFTLDRHGCPRFDGCAASFACRVHTVHRAGDHDLVIGEVTAFQVLEPESTAEPLVFHGGAYRQLEPYAYAEPLAG